MFEPCEILRDRAQISEASSLLKGMGVSGNPICECKDWDMAHVLPRLSHGNLLDMGCQGSPLLGNAETIGIVGEKIGIDLVPLPQRHGITLVQGDMTKTNFPSEHFDYITCLSVVEHGVNIKDFSKECSRLLRPGGKLFLTFDYWNPKIHTNMTLFGAPWNIFCKEDAEFVIHETESNGMAMVVPMNWTQGNPVIRPGYHSPGSVSYSFGILEMEKRK
jgi:SAM-dependent methyltransferase